MAAFNNPFNTQAVVNGGATGAALGSAAGLLHYVLSKNKKKSLLTSVGGGALLGAGAGAGVGALQAHQQQVGGAKWWNSITPNSVDPDPSEPDPTLHPVHPGDPRYPR